MELSQPGWIGSLRVAGLYFAGAILGSLGGTVSDPCNYLCGASGAVYALIFAHLATLILNWNEDGKIYDERVKENKSNDDKFLPTELNPWIRGIRLAFIILFTFVELGTTIKNTYVNSCFFKTSYKKFKVLTLYRHLLQIKTEHRGNTSYAGHAFGAIAGATIGVVILKNRRVEDWEVTFQKVVFAIYGLLSCVFIAWHIAGGSYGYFPSDSTDQCDGKNYL